ncbi:tubulin epsilon chain, putative [Eimeria acervulina]|uniref:Tubulin epsilon chain, putative n=1 Tax=Eimeria acervulina TaxID=5801 RepID=U6GKV6_EIMAC|nr:tubulin epsilon chain, putative [Eimeria acervulina]CDI80202.1 tubulin epsilon chain, putative [Eimeria acervulina]
MPREVITFQIGQCGNQIGSQLWEVLLKEHLPKLTSALPAATAVGVHASTFDEGTSSIFRLRTNSRLRMGEAGAGDLKARAILIDMEEGVVNRLLRGRLSSLFDDTLLVTDVSGSGNNCPGETDDVITSPYNATLALQGLRQDATCVFPLCNDSLTQKVPGLENLNPAKPFAHANAVAAQMLAHLTSSVRFSGPLDMDLLDISSNLVPYKGLHFLVSNLGSSIQRPVRNG